MHNVFRIIQHYFACKGGELWIGGVPINNIVDRYGTPLFIYDRGIIDQKLTSLRKVLPSGFEIYYSIKANPNQAILKYFISQGCGLEVASGGEFYQALVAGCSPGKILFAGPGKTESELEYALEKGIGSIHVESLQEIDRIIQIASKRGIQANIAIRVNPGEEAQGGAMRMGGKPSQFGVDEEILDTTLDRVLCEEMLNFCGIHLFTGTQILDYNVLIRQYRKGLEIAKCAASKAKTSIRTMDFGGGLGIPYFNQEKELDVIGFGKELLSLILETKKQPEFEGTAFILEPGRYLIGEGGIYVTQITTIKESRGKKFLIVDGGMNHHLAASGNLGQVIKRNFPISILNKLEMKPEETVDVVGPLCTPLDVLARDVILPSANIGDLVGIFQSGAYARTASPLGFLSHMTPPEILVDNGEINLVRRRGDYKDLIHDNV